MIFFFSFFSDLLAMSKWLGERVSSDPGGDVFSDDGVRLTKLPMVSRLEVGSSTVPPTLTSSVPSEQDEDESFFGMREFPPILLGSANERSSEPITPLVVAEERPWSWIEITSFVCLGVFLLLLLLLLLMCVLRW